VKKRILFVDDESLALEGLQRMLRPMRAEWEMVFVENGAKALELMEQGPFDVVISDMRMPGMNGAELLAEVLKRFPKTVRLILSGYADRDLVLKCVGSTHQYLSKPCRPEELKAAITRAGDLDTIKSLVLSIHAFSQFATVKLGTFSIDSLWVHSQSTAGLAKEIARIEDADHQLVDEAFVAGLLHDAGKLVLASNFPAQYNQMLQTARGGSLALLAAEERTFGANHAEVGGYLLGLSGLPVPVVEAIAFHHRPGRCPHLALSPLTAVHAANALVNVRQVQGDELIAEELDLNYLGKLGLEHRLEHWRALADANLRPQPLKS
jgi:CheY-like chemotaxis protein